MKSSTIRRSNLSKEKMAVLEALAKYRNEAYDNNSPSVYIRHDKEKELDLLWNKFNLKRNKDNSSNVYLFAGFIIGAVVMLILTVFISFSVKGINSMVNNHVAPAKKEKINLSFMPASESNAENEGVNEVYTVQSGDTMEAILVRFYGSYSKEKEALVLKTNNLTNPNKLSIGQQLTIPME